ncbi:chloride channel 3/4/5, partial [Paragonimus westermani]
LDLVREKSTPRGLEAASDASGGPGSSPYASGSTSAAHDPDCHRNDEQVNVQLEPGSSSLEPLAFKYLRLSSRATVTHLRKYVAQEVLHDISRFRDVVIHVFNSLLLKIDIFILNNDDGTFLGRDHVLKFVRVVYWNEYSLNVSIFVRFPCFSFITTCSCFSALFYAALLIVLMFPDSMNPFADPHSLIGAVPLDKPPRSRSPPIPSTTNQWSSSHHTASDAPASSDVAVLNDDTVDQLAPGSLTVKYTAKPHGHAVGLITGIIACVIDIGSTWMSDLKEGVCVEAFWFNREQCCWSSNQTDGVCDQWFTWSRLFLGKDPTGQNPEAYFVGYLFYICFAILFAGICVFLVRMFAPYACGSGIAEIKTILGGFIIRGFLGKWTLLIKSVGMILGVASGLSLGKEGPMVHIATCVGNIVAYLFPKYGRNEAKKREILSASAAAAVAVAFGAPIGGVLFSLEEASYYFPMKTMFRSFFCAMVSANVLHMLNPYGSDTMIMFSVDYKAQWHVMELFPFALLGFLGGIFGTIFNRANLYICHLRKSTWLGHHPVREVLVVATVTALISFPHAYLRMDTSALIKLLVSPCSPVDDMSICDYRINLSDPMGNILGSYPSGPTMSTAMILLLTGLFLKLVLTIFTIGIKVPTGLFIPSL